MGMEDSTDKKKGSKVEKGKWYDISDEAMRTYTWKDKQHLTIMSPQRFMLSKSGRHYIETSDNNNYIIAQGWLYLTFLSKKGFTIGSTPQEAA